jgi:hypothetical protein
MRDQPALNRRSQNIDVEGRELTDRGRDVRSSKPMAPQWQQPWKIVGDSVIRYRTVLRGDRAARCASAVASRAGLECQGNIFVAEEYWLLK